MKGDEERIREGGCEAYLSKPISTNPVFGVPLNLSIASATNESRAFAGVGRERRFEGGGHHVSATLTGGCFGRCACRKPRFGNIGDEGRREPVAM
jgi:hypothetical protein